MMKDKCGTGEDIGIGIWKSFFFSLSIYQLMLLWQTGKYGFVMVGVFTEGACQCGCVKRWV